MKRKRIKVGDIFEIPLSDGRKAYGQYICADKDNGPMVQIFNLITDDDIQINEIVSSPNMFPPIIVGLGYAIKTEMWTIVGNSPMRNFDPPDFISAMYNGINKKMGMWYLWDGKKSEYIPIGYQLPDKYRGLEQLLVWAAEDVAKRIETGINSYDSWLDL